VQISTRGSFLVGIASDRVQWAGLGRPDARLEESSQVDGKKEGPTSGAVLRRTKGSEAQDHVDRTRQPRKGHAQGLIRKKG